MHELGIVVAIIKQVEEIAVANKVKRVTEVTLEIGEVSGIVPKYLTDAWKWAVDNRSTYLKGCKLNIITLKAKSFCTNCETAYDTMKYAKICPNCGSDKTYLLTGKEANIKDIKVEN
ncbi:MAG: hydrogenase maturation nickel metallochaperone HypA [Bacilli bacterium]|nr:hydrogenase maturation nickel metallochaperone HypA [Bacilli bacterium]